MTAATPLQLRRLRRKAWNTLVARAAMLGGAVWRSDPSDGARRYFVESKGVVKACSLDRLHSVLSELGDAP